MKHKFANILKQMQTEKKLPECKRMRPDFFENDKVQIIGGRADVNKKGTILYVDKRNNRVLIQGLNLVKKSVRKSAVNPTSTFINIEQPIDYNNIMLIDPITE